MQLRQGHDSGLEPEIRLFTQRFYQNGYLDKARHWPLGLTQMSDIPILTVDATQEEPTYAHALTWLLPEIKARFG